MWFPYFCWNKKDETDSSDIFIDLIYNLYLSYNITFQFKTFKETLNVNKQIYYAHRSTAANKHRKKWTICAVIPKILIKKSSIKLLYFANVKSLNYTKPSSKAVSITRVKINPKQLFAEHRKLHCTQPAKRIVVAYEKWYCG